MCLTHTTCVYVYIVCKHYVFVYPNLIKHEVFVYPSLIVLLFDPYVGTPKTAKYKPHKFSLMYCCDYNRICNRALECRDQHTHTHTHTHTHLQSGCRKHANALFSLIDCLERHKLLKRHELLM